MKIPNLVKDMLLTILLIIETWFSEGLTADQIGTLLYFITLLVSNPD